jgi:pterin-4a-carbinolamine dehydratase
MVDRLVGAARHAALRELKGWSEVEDRDAIRKSFHFSNFPPAQLFGGARPCAARCASRQAT